MIAPVLLPALLLSCSIELVESGGHVYTDSFPTNDEYDFKILDPNTIYGSPYGGYSRATRSRLASLPLPFPTSSEKEAEEPEYMKIRDGEGRLFACRTYHEDEVHPSSLTDSMFDHVRLRVPSEDEEEGEEDDDQDDDEEEESSADNKQDSTAVGTTTKKDPALITIERALRMLQPICAQIHTGWWSYEWCHEDYISQFHVHMEETRHGATVNLQDFTKLGTFKLEHRTIQLTSQNSPVTTDGQEPSPKAVPSSPEASDAKPEKKVVEEDDDDDDDDGAPLGWKESFAKGVTPLGEVIDHYTSGDICKDINAPRQAWVNLRCCNMATMKKYKGAVSKLGPETNAASVVSLLEDPTSICTYNVTVCTPLLCKGIVEKLPGVNDPDEGSTTAGKTFNRKRRKKGKESIREIISRNLEDVGCLRRNNNEWWQYQICHGKHIRQFHEVSTIDAVTGITGKYADAEYILGVYNDTALQDFPNEEEINYVVNATKEQQDFMAKAGRGVQQRGAPSDGPYFKQEWLGGHVCDHPDVSDAAVKAGNVGEGGIERSTTVRYFCGARLELAMINEDSTCHYEMNVVIPDLCDHPLFKPPVSKKKVVKCLPVEEENVEYQ